MYMIRLKYTATDNNPRYKPGTIKTYFFGKGHKELTKRNLVECFPRKSEAVQSLAYYNQFVKAEETLNFWTVEVSIVECFPKGNPNEEH